MKTKNYSILFSVIVIGFFLCSCKSCPDTPQAGNTYNLTNNAGLLPYKDFDTIKFLKDNLDTVVFLGSKVNYSYNTAYTHDDCPLVEKLQQGTQMFTSNLGSSFSLLYHILPSYEGHSGQYSISFNNESFGPYDEIDVLYITNKDTLYVVGKPYIGIQKLISNTDTIYYKAEILRIKYQNTVYEKFP